jgi:hypothetical protein
MVKIALTVAAAAAVLMTAPLSTPTQAQGVQWAQGVDVQIGRDRDRDPDSDRDYRRRYNRDTTIGVSPGGVTIGPRRCRTVTTTVERDDGRMIRRKERRCD